MTKSNRAVASIDARALQHNLRQAAELVGTKQLLPVIKANGYGHGLANVAAAILACDDLPARLTGCAVAGLSEAATLRDAGWSLPILYLPGFVCAAELAQCFALELDLVVHSHYQVSLLLAAFAAEPTRGRVRVWLKANTGMNRLGMNEEEWVAAFKLLKMQQGIELVAMSHLACADDQESSMTHRQLGQFEGLLSEIPTRTPRSLAASGGILAWPHTHYDIVRPGIMLYGSSPFAERSAEELGLKPVMTLRSRLIALNEIKKGDTVGYGAAFTAVTAMRLGVVSIGYGDGYPRKAPTGTPVLVSTSAGLVRTRLIGRVSMDMITIDITGLDCALDAEVVLWGEGLPADEIAAACGTIAYELFCQVTLRVPREVVGTIE